MGADGRALGGEGDDRFFVQEGGGNIIAGGEGSDEFWILTDDPDTVNTPNIIVDFETGVDMLGFVGQDSVTLYGNSIAVNNQTIAILNGIDFTNLMPGDIIFQSNNDNLIDISNGVDINTLTA